MTEALAKEISLAAEKLANATTELKRAKERSRLANSDECLALNTANGAAKELDALIQRSKEMMPTGTDWSTK